MLNLASPLRSNPDLGVSSQSLFLEVQSLRPFIHMGVVKRASVQKVMFALTGCTGVLCIYV